MTQTDIFRKTGITVEKDEQARAAVKAFRGLLPTLNAYVRILTKRPDVRIEMAAGDNGSTDGKKIYFRPPIALGDKTPHDRRKCDKRDENLQLLCAACGIRESVLVTIYHEIAHICFDTFAPASERDITRTIQGAVQAVGTHYGEQIEKRIRALPSYKRQSYMDLAGTISPFLPIIVNALEDARVNGEMFRARPGTKVMFAADEWKTFTNGVEQADRFTGAIKTVMWSDYPPNLQVIIGLFAKAAGHDYSEFFIPQVVQTLDDETITKLIDKLGTMPGASGTYFLSFPILARLRELGFCKSDMDPEPEPEPESEDQPEEQNDEQGEDDGEPQRKPELGEAQGSGERDDSQDGGEDEGRPDTHPAEDEDAGDDESDGSPEDASGSSGDEDSGDGSPEDQQPDSDGSDDSEGSSEGEGEDEQGDADGTDNSGAGLGESADEAGASGGDDQSDEPAGDDAGTPGGSDGGGSSEPEDGGDDSDGHAGEPEQDADQSGDAGDGAHSRDDANEDEVDDEEAEAGNDSSDAPDAGSAGDSSDEGEDGSGGNPEDTTIREHSSGEHDGEQDGSEGGSGGDSDASDMDGDDSSSDGSEGPRQGSAEAEEREADSEASGGDDSGGEESGSQPRPDVGGDSEATDGDAGEAGSDVPDVQDDAGDDDGEPIDSGADDGTGGVRVLPLPEDMGTAEEAAEGLDKWVHHDEKPKNAVEAKDEEAVDRALVQGIYFETPSINIFGVREHREGQPASDGDGVPYSGAWDRRKYSRWATAREAGIDGDFEPSEKVLGPALMRMRVAFSDNQRGHEQRHLKNGKVDPRVLGRRAHFGDERLFKRRQLPGKKNYFVLIGMDVSGSTIGRNLLLEKQAVMAQARLLSRMGIQFAIYAHSGGWHKQGEPASGMDLDIYLIKEPDEPLTAKVEERITSLGPDSGNLDGHTLEYYRKVLDGVQATDKIILYYTDGKMPASNHDEELEILQREIRTCKRKGYTLLGVGIKTDSPTQHGLDTVQVDSEEDVVKVVKHIEKRLLSR